jgi:cyclopropane fatty-acyl-phospholipid synthase-like methyltransferase
MSKNLWKSTPDWFEPWFNTPEYHLLYGHRSELEAIAFVEKLTEHHTLLKREQSILDIGCGAGRHSAAMASMGHKVVGMDLSANSITKASAMYASTELRLQFVQGDMRNIASQFAPDAFEAVTMLFTSFGYFDKEEEHEQTLRGVRTVLKAQGPFILDFLNLHQVKNALVPFERIMKGGTEFELNRRIADGWIEKSIQYIDSEGTRQHHVERVKAFSPENLQTLLETVGFRSFQTFGNYKLDPLVKSSPRCIIVAH